MSTIEQITHKYQEMIEEATRTYESQLAAASQYYYVELSKIHQNVNRQVDNLVNTLASLSVLPKEE